MSASRPLTPFELFLQRRQQVTAEDDGASESRNTGNPAALAPSDPSRALLPPPKPDAGPVAAAAAAVASGPPPPPPPTPSAQRSSHNRVLDGYSSSAANKPASGRPRRSAPQLTPQIVASMPSPRATDGHPGGGGSGNRPPAASTAAGGPTAVYGELASAAASLASAAQKLARGNGGDRSVAASYETLAQAAAELAASACQIRPLTSSSLRDGQQHGGGGTVMTMGGRVSIPSLPKPFDAHSSATHLPRAVDPMAAAAAAEAVSAAAAAAKPVHQNQQNQQNLLGQQHQAVPPHSARPGTGSSTASGRRRVEVPRFSGYVPMFYLMDGGMAALGAAASHQQRPSTSSPITHQLFDAHGAQQPSSGGPGSAASHVLSRSRRRSSSNGAAGSSLQPGHAGASGAAGPRLHPGDLSRVPVLGPDGLPVFGPSASAAGSIRDVWVNDQLGGGPVELSSRAGTSHRQSARRYADAVADLQLADPHVLLSPYSDVRPSEWPPAEPITAADVDQDEVDRRYNKVLAVLRERVYTRGHHRVAAAFRDLDRDGSGMLSRGDFAAVLQAMNLGPVGLVDDKVIDLMMAAVEGGGTGWRPPRVSYGDFINALRFGTMPWRGYSHKLRHRASADPDQPIGPPRVAAGLPPYSIAYGNQPAAAGHFAAASGVGAASGAAAAAAAAAAGPTTDGRMRELRHAFRAVDRDGDGVVEWEEFREALRRAGEQQRLRLSDTQLLQIYKDADPDFNTGVDYEAFMAAYAASGAAAAGGRLPDDALTSSGAPPSRHGILTYSPLWAAQTLPRLPPTPHLPPQTPLTPLYDQLDALRCTGSADGLPPAAAGGGGGARVRWNLGPGAGLGSGTGGGAPWAGASLRTDPLREMHAGAAAVLQRLGSSGGVGRAAVRG